MNVLRGLVLFSAALVTSCAPAPAREIRIGLLAVLEGEYASTSGEPSLDGARLAVSELNAAGGVVLNGHRHTIVLVERSHATRPDAAASAARASINIDRVDVLIGPQLSTHALAAGAVAEDAQVPMISPMASNPGVTAGRRFVFRMAFLDAFQGALLADYAWRDRGARRAAMLYDVAHPYSAEIANLFAETFEQRGGTIVARETFTTDQRSGYTAQLRRIAASGAQVLLLPNYAATASVQAREGRALGVRASLLGSDSWDMTSMALTPEADSSVVVHQWHPDIPLEASRAFVRRFSHVYGRPPRATAALTYDAVHLAVGAIRRSGSLEGVRVADALLATGTFEGASGILRFDGHHDPRRSGVLSMLKGGRHTLLRVVEANP